MAERPGKLDDELNDLRSQLTETRAQLRAMESCIAKYQPFLDELMSSAQFWTGIRKEILLHALRGSVWASLAAILLVLGLGAQKWLKGWLT